MSYSEPQRKETGAPEELKDGEHDVVDVAETAGFALFGVVESSRPVECNVGLALGQSSGPACRAKGSVAVSARRV
jgi:hypothetical protein